jgi:hypothetical protein
VHTLVDEHWLHQTETFFPANLQQVPAHISLSWMWTIEFCSVEPFKTIMILPKNQRRKITLPSQIHYRPKCRRRKIIDFQTTNSVDLAISIPIRTNKNFTGTQERR